LERIAILTSGGLDSSVLLAEEAKTAEVYPIYVRCGLAWEDAERKALDAFLNALTSPNVKPVTTLSAPVRAMYGDHWSVGADGVPGADEPDTSVFLPGRNILLIGLAAVWCSTHNVFRIGDWIARRQSVPRRHAGFLSEVCRGAHQRARPCRRG
jgi:7-cyano-7-deazaguanine synthase